MNNILMQTLAKHSCLEHAFMHSDSEHQNGLEQAKRKAC